MAGEKTLKPVERIIFPLDVPSWDKALKLATILNGHVGWFKVGLELFIGEGPSVIKRLKEAAPDTKIFLDLKLHDIPATVGQAMSRVAALGVDLITVHAQGGTEMMKAAVANSGSSGVLGVTVLTSLNPADFSELSEQYRKPGALVSILGCRAVDAGCRGLVASGHEVAILREKLGPKPWLVIPGIRPAWSQVAGDDQKRTATPCEVIKAGGDLLVIGRPIRDAADPAEAADKVADELRGL